MRGEWRTWADAATVDIKAALGGPVEQAEDHLNDAIASIRLAIEALQPEED